MNYVNYNFENLKWTSPLFPKSFGVTSAKSFCVSAMSQAGKTLELAVKKVETLSKKNH